MKRAHLVWVLAAVSLSAGLLLRWRTTTPTIPPVERISHGRFEDVAMIRPRGQVRQFVLFLSGDGGWDGDMTRLARTLADQGALVAGINMPQLVGALEADDADCVFPDGDLENLSHYVQAYYRLPTYLTPLLVGYSSGATMAYAMIAQAPPHTFAGAISLGFCPDLEMKKPLCKGENVHQRRRADGGTDLLPAAQLSVPWIVLHGEQDDICPAAPAWAFVDRVAGSAWMPLPRVGHDYATPGPAREQLGAAYARFAPDRAPAIAPPPGGLADLPIVEVPATAAGDDRYAVLLSGDGGWAGLDQELAAALAARGIPVIGLDSLRYFWTARTPEGLAADLDRVIRHYAAHWNKTGVLLIGYSQGADVLPFAINRLPPASKSLLRRSVLLGPGEKAAFEFHLSNWIGDSGDRPIASETASLVAAQTLCLYGFDDDESLCPRLAARNVQAIGLSGGHHFDGAYDKLAELILSGVQVP